jgi:predicted RNA binding protein YcfA (HicA-like mRNA interferase family)
MSGNADANLAFADVCQILLRLGFNVRIRGDHYIFTKDTVEEILNLQPKGVQAKPYQVKQIRNVFRRYHLDIEDNE